MILTVFYHENVAWVNKVRLLSRDQHRGKILNVGTDSWSKRRKDPVFPPRDELFSYL